MTKSYRMEEIYRAIPYKKRKGITSSQFSQIIQRTNMYIMEELFNGGIVRLPSGMGELELLKYTPKVKLVDGKLINQSPIDWGATNKLWETDKEAKKKKILIRFEVSEVFKFHYRKKNATYKNKSFYTFSVPRSIKRCLKDKINNQEGIDAPMLK